MILMSVMDRLAADTRQHTSTFHTKAKVLLKLYFVLYAEVLPPAGTNNVVHTAKTTRATMALFYMIPV